MHPRALQGMVILVKKAGAIGVKESRMRDSSTDMEPVLQTAN